MSSLALFDLAIGAGDSLTEGPNKANRLADRLVDAALGSLRYLRELDAALAPVAGGVFDRRAAVPLRAMYEEWGRDTESVLERVRRIEESSGRSVEGAVQLRDDHGRVMAMLSVTLNDIDQARDQIRREQTFSIEEVRRDLRATAHR